MNLINGDCLEKLKERDENDDALKAQLESQKVLLRMREKQIIALKKELEQKSKS